MKSKFTKLVLVPCLCIGLLFPLMGRAGLAGDIEKAVEEIAEMIALDSGRPAANFMSYATRLVHTLGALTPDAQERVLGDYADEIPYDAEDEVTWGAGANDGTDGSTTTDPTGTPADDPDVDGPLLDAITGDPPMPPSDLRDLLVEASPLSVAVFDAVIQRGLPPSDLEEVFVANVPLPSHIYADVEAGHTDLSNSGRLHVLDAHHSAMSGLTAP